MKMKIILKTTAGLFGQACYYFDGDQQTNQQFCQALNSYFSLNTHETRFNLYYVNSIFVDCLQPHIGSLYEILTL